MSQTIDNRVVQMEFDNRGFEQGVKTSVASLEKLKKGLDLDKATASLQNLENTFKGFSVGGLEDALYGIADSFTFMGRVAMNVLDNITNRAVNAGISLAKSMTIDNIKGGFGKYEQMMNATQAMRNATGQTVDEISVHLDKLMKYTDETSYSYSQMVSAMGRFSSAGITDLGLAEQSVQGIANAAADAGIGINEAGRLFEVFSKAMNTGHLTRNQWDSLAIANFNTPKFQKALIAAGKAVGTIDAKTGRLINKKGRMTKTVVNFQNLADTLREDWVNLDALNLALAAYGDETNEAAKKLAVFDADLANVGRSSYESAQKAKTFTDVVDALKDAISSGWMVSFTTLFGDLDESIKFWTDVADGIIEIISDIADRRNKMLEGWKKQGGYEDLTGGIMNVIHVFNALYDSARLAFDIFTSGNKLGFDKEIGSFQFMETTSSLYKVTKAFKEATDVIKGFFVELTDVDEDGEEFVTTRFNQNLIDTLRGVYSIAFLAGDAIGSVFSGIWTVLKKFVPLATKLTSVLGKIGVFFNNVYKYFKDNKIFDGWVNNFIEGFQPIFDLIPKAVEWIDKFVEHIGLNEAAQEGFNNELKDSKSPLANIVKGFESLLDILSQFAGFGANIFSKIVEAIAPYAGEFIIWLADMASGLGEWITKVKESGVVTDILNEWSEKIGTAIDTLKHWGEVAWDWIDSTGILDALKTKFNSFILWIRKNVFGENVDDELSESIRLQLSKMNGNVDLAHRKAIDAKKLAEAGWDDVGEGIATVYSSTHTGTFGDGTYVFGMTPILPNGEVLSPKAFDDYVDSILSIGENGSFADALKWDKNNKNLMLPYLQVPEGEEENIDTYIGRLDDQLIRIHEMHEALYDGPNKAVEDFTAEVDKQSGVVGLARTALENLHKAITDLADWLNNHSLSNMLGDFFGKGTAFLASTFDKIGQFFSVDTSGIEGTGSKIAARLEVFKVLDEEGNALEDNPLNGFISMLQGLAENLNGVDSVAEELGFDEGLLEGIFGVIKRIAGMATDVAMEIGKKIDIGAAAKLALGSGGIMALIKGALDILKTIENWKNTSEIAGNIGETVESTKDILKNIADNGLGGLMKGKETIREKFNNIAQSLLFVAGGIWLVADAMNKLKDLDIKQLSMALLGTAGSGGILALIVKFTQDFQTSVSQTDVGKKMTTATKRFSSLWDGVSFLAIAAAIEKLANGLKTLVALDLTYGDIWKQVGQEAVLGGIVAAIKKFTESFSSTEESENGSLFGESAKTVKKVSHGSKLWDSISFVSIASAIGKMAEGLKTLVQLEQDYGDIWDNVLQEGALGGILAAVKVLTSEFTTANFKVKSTNPFDGLVFLEISQAIYQMAEGLAILVQLDQDNMGDALIAMTVGSGLLVGLKAFIDYMNRSAPQLTIRGAIANAIGGSGIGFVTIAQGLKAMAEGLVILDQLDNSWKAVGQAAVLETLTAVITKFLGNMSVGETSKAMLNVGVIVGSVTGILEALGGLNDFLAEKGWDMEEKLKSAGDVLYNIGNAIGKLFGGLADGFRGKSVTEALTEELTGNGGSLSDALNNISDFSEKLSGVDFDVIDRFLSTVQGLNVTSTQTSTFPNMANNITQLGDAFNGFASDVTETSVANAGNAARILESFFRIARLIGESDAFKSGEDMGNILADFFSGVNLKGKGNLGGMIGDFARQFMIGFTAELQNGTDETESSTGVLMSAALGEIAAWDEEFFDAGKNITEGVAEGISNDEVIDKVREAVIHLGDVASATFQLSVKEASPSKLFAKHGLYLALGVVQGVEEGENPVRKAIEGLGSVIVDTAEGAMNNDLSFSPQITPVMDVSNIREGMTYMNGALKDARDVIVPGFGNSNIQTELVAGSTSNNIIDAINQVNIRIGELGDAMATMQVVMNGGALVGQITPDIDRSLGLRAIREGRRG